MSYTKGPWYVEMTTKVDGKDISHSICYGINEYSDGPAGQVCLATSGRRADAELIAAAPELLNLVIDAIEDETEFETDWNKQARKLVDRIKGRSND